MKYLSAPLLLAAAVFAGCSTTSNNANMRGTNTNTGYTTNSETNVKPLMPANVTNISPGTSSSAPAANHGANGYMAPNSNKKMSGVNSK